MKCSRRRFLIVYNPTFLNGTFHGLVEGTITNGSAGLPVAVYRVDDRDPQERALIARPSRDGSILGFDPQKDFVNFPGGCKKFIIRYDHVSIMAKAPIRATGG
jgi:hypothetical protein